MKKDYVIYIVIAVLTILFLLTTPGKRVLFYLEWQYHSRILGEDGLYSPILQEYYCSDGRACRHEEGHKEDHSLGWFSETLEFEHAIEILAECAFPLTQLPVIQFVLSDRQLTDHELYAELFVLVDTGAYDNLAALLSSYVEICAEFTPEPTPTKTPKLIETITPTETVRFIGVCYNDAVISILVPNIFVFPVTQQPIGEPAFVTEQEDTITQFQLASEYRSVGLIAHNYLAGFDFPQIDIGQTIILTCAHPTPFTYTETYIVVEILRFQALQPLSPFSDFVDLETGAGYTNAELFNLIYNRPGYLILQTSIATPESGAWGRLFIIAERK